MGAYVKDLPSTPQMARYTAAPSAYADPTVQQNILTTLDRIVPWRGDYAHREGNSAAHVKASLLGSSCTVPVMGWRLRLGTWQGLYLAEFDGPRTRQVWVKVIAG